VTVNRRLVLRAILLFLPLAVLASGLAGTIYVVVQQELRSGADSPQLQLAEDAARALNGGAAAASVTGAATVDIAQSLAPYVVVFDANGHPLASSGQLDGAPPAPPKGVLDAAVADGSNRVTWQPRADVRLATVTVPWSGGTVMAGRSLREVERREDQALAVVAAGWAATLGAVALACLFVAWLGGRRPPGDSTTR
jgi:hypothetical protein